MIEEGKVNYRERLSEVKRSLFLRLRWNFFSWSWIVTLCAHVSTHRPHRSTRYCRSRAYSDYISIWMGMWWTYEEGEKKTLSVFRQAFWIHFTHPPSNLLSPFLVLQNEKHRTMDRFAWSFSLLPAFFCWPFGENIDFRFLRQPSRKPPSRFCRREEQKEQKEKKRKMLNKLFISFSFLLISSLTDSSIEKLSRIWDATSFLWRAKVWLQDDDTRHPNEREMRKLGKHKKDDWKFFCDFVSVRTWILSGLKVYVWETSKENLNV